MQAVKNFFNAAFNYFKFLVAALVIFALGYFYGQNTIYANTQGVSMAQLNSLAGTVHLVAPAEAAAPTGSITGTLQNSLKAHK